MGVKKSQFYMAGLQYMKCQEVGVEILHRVQISFMKKVIFEKRPKENEGPRHAAIWRERVSGCGGGTWAGEGVCFFGMFKVNEEAWMTREKKVRSKGSWGTDHVGSCQFKKDLGEANEEFWIVKEPHLILLERTMCCSVEVTPPRLRLKHSSS